MGTHMQLRTMRHDTDSMEDKYNECIHMHKQHTHIETSTCTRLTSGGCTSNVGSCACDVDVDVDVGVDVDVDVGADGCAGSCADVR